ncbi:helix-turn-helix domain-containing protein [Marivirga sericea]|uniref:helix-turn-helix domain-containing protein n=1 Tax=Marivirga sericea TaxID=1028 RepID=UPI000A1CAB55|nr:helix-turn-helix transcriptional regulator [Marivirga sericea]
MKAVINIDFNWHAALIKHLFPFVLLLVIAGLIFPSEECWICSEWLRHMMYVIWFYYILLTIITLKKPFRNLLTYHGKLSDLDIWLITITIGIAVVWLAYLITNYSSYIIGAWSFTFVFYAVLFIWLYKFKRTSLFFEKQEKYVDKKIRAVEAKEFGQRLQSFFYVQKPFKDPNLKLSDVALSLEVTPHYLSQFLNDNKNITFSSYINEYRVEEAKLLLGSNNLITIEAIGQECGFKSNSSFYSAFKKLEGVTPAKFKKQYL